MQYDMPMALDVDFIEELYRNWKQNPNSVDPQWREYFTHLDDEEQGTSSAPPGDQEGASLGDRMAMSDRDPPRHVLKGEDGHGTVPAVSGTGSDHGYKQGRVTSLIWAYRDIGYLYADTNPLKGYITPELYYMLFSIEGDYETLTLKEFGLSEEDLDTEFYAGMFLQPSIMPLRDILAKLKEIYCSTMGCELLHIQNKVMRRWLMERLEGHKAHRGWEPERKIQFQKDLMRAELFERFIHSSFTGQKRFSLEGGEALIPALRYLIGSAAENGIQEIVFGMAHRGRLNVFVNGMGRPAVDIFSLFEDKSSHKYGGSGDVKYHQGFAVDYVDEENRKVHLSLVANPSHLEAVDPVVQGKTRGLQRIRGDKNRKKVIPVLIHGDAAFSGQGVVTETLNLSQLKGYKTGGTIHIIVNNQIGFTTASRDARSTFFATDVAKSMSIPIFHVNGDDPEAVVQAMDLAVRFRQKFGYDVIVDIVCYRRLGHNEADEPSYTHPKMYSYIKQHKSAPALYGQRLQDQGIWSTDQQKAFKTEYNALLREHLDRARAGHVPDLTIYQQEGDWKDVPTDYSFDPVSTSVPVETLDFLAEKLTQIPEDFNLHSKLQRFVDERKKQYYDEKAVDWAYAESFAFGSLLLEGYPIRLSGEDCQRGTFSQRHAVWWDIDSPIPRPHTALRTLGHGSAWFSVYDSPLSEFAVLGFDYGYSLAFPKGLNLWEAQFGDFVNGAQVIIDNFIVSAETKWLRSSGLVMLLPHGYEGQGPEHSSAHLERFLSLCAENNIQVTYPSTPAQYYHLLRRQGLQPFRKPLIVMTPKSLLRRKEARSPIEELAHGKFHYVLDDGDNDPKAERLLLCSGKVYYDLKQAQQERNNRKTAIVRVEQLYPFPLDQLRAVFDKYTKAKRIMWVQEESRNRGGWIYMEDKMAEFFPEIRISYLGRPAGASPSAGSHHQHVIELNDLLDAAMGKEGKHG